MADYFQGLGDDMASAYKDRTGMVAAIAKDTEGLLKKFHRDHADMAQALKAKLTKEENDRVGQTQAEIKARIATVNAILSDFDKTHAEMAASLRSQLAEVKPGLAKSEDARRQQDQAEIKEREADVAALLKQFDEEHAKMSEALLSMLTKEEKERRETSQAENRERASQWGAAVRKMAGVRGTKVVPQETPAKEEEREEAAFT